MLRVDSEPRYWRTPPLSVPRRPALKPVAVLYSGNIGHVKPIIGITRTALGTKSVLRWKIESTAGLYAGWSPYRLPSTRNPYWTVGREGVGVPGGTEPAGTGLYVSP